MNSRLGPCLRAVLLCAGLLSLPPRLWSQTFTRVTTGPVVSTPGDTLGGIWGDFDNDGDLDLAVAELTSPNKLYRNDGTGRFEQVTGLASFEPFQIPSTALAWCDYDNDGDLDLAAAIGSGDRLYERTPAGFTRVTTFPGRETARVPMTVNCVDANHDGLLDLFVATGGGALFVEDTFYQNLGGGAFAVVTSGTAVSLPGMSGGSSWADYDGDGWIDLFVPNGFTGNFLLRNDSRGDFLRVTEPPVGTDLLASDGSAWGDYDNDGDFDLFVSNGADQDNTLYRNDGARFTTVTNSILVSHRGYSVGAAWADYDNDGRLDLAVANRLGPCFLYRQLTNGLFTVASNVVSTTFADANSVSWADINQDGFLDLFVGNWAGEGGPDLDELYVNDGNSNAWLRVELEGRTSNRTGIGARVRATAVVNGSSTTQLRQIGGTDSAGAGALEAHFGLGDAGMVEKLQVEWPSGILQVVTNVTVRQRLRLVEPEIVDAGIQASPAPGNFTNAVQVTLTWTPGALLRYWVASAEGGGRTNLYDGPITLRAAATIHAQQLFRGQPFGAPVVLGYQRIYAHAGDGVGEAWRTRWFGVDYSPFDPSVAPEADPDGDGARNLQESAAQTNPLNPASVLRLRVRLVPQIYWESVPGVTYQVRRRDPAATNGWQDVGTALPGTGAEMDLIDATVVDPYGVYVIEPNPPPNP